MNQSYLTEYSLLFLFVVLSVIVPIGMLAAAKFGTSFGVTPSRSTKIKKAAYEGGHPAFSEKPSLFSFGYFYYALLFVAFDVETILIFPWAVSHGYITSVWGVLPFIGVLVFLTILTVSFVYVWLKGALEWIK
ncbi:MAG: NADH-quinone oxidoreductase subunit A [Dehalococcoidia bacterium]|jgi:NADH-quinone oxidoreductase subunit A|nr:NADH-quinone oxidoreductase subunit A [Dehalococcoidia bacterium]